MKKLTVIVLTLLIVIGMAGCSSAVKESSSQSELSSQSEASSKEIQSSTTESSKDSESSISKGSDSDEQYYEFLKEYTKKLSEEIKTFLDLAVLASEKADLIDDEEWKTNFLESSTGFMSVNQEVIDYDTIELSSGAKEVHTLLSQGATKFIEGMKSYQKGFDELDTDLLTEGSIFLTEGSTYLNNASAKMLQNKNLK